MRPFILVTAIAAGLAFIFRPCLACCSEKARVAASESQMAQFAIALNAYKKDVGIFPVGRHGLNDLIFPRSANNWKGPYLEADAIPNDPWGNVYLYECPGKHNRASFDLMSMGKDGQVGGRDDITNWTQKK